jgi:hypothetical protein
MYHVSLDITKKQGIVISHSCCLLYTVCHGMCKYIVFTLRMCVCVLALSQYIGPLSQLFNIAYYWGQLKLYVPCILVSFNFQSLLITLLYIQHVHVICMYYVSVQSVILLLCMTLYHVSVIDLDCMSMHG